MILLIQELQEKYDLLDENLNSIMILLIPEGIIHANWPDNNLNSIMILLIHSFGIVSERRALLI